MSCGISKRVELYFEDECMIHLTCSQSIFYVFLQLTVKYGGHIFVEINTKLTITDSLFDGSIVTRNGGHIYVGATGGTTIYIKNSQFYRSSGAGNGGFLSAVFSTVTLIDVVSDGHSVYFDEGLLL